MYKNKVSLDNRTVREWSLVSQFSELFPSTLRFEYHVYNCQMQFAQDAR